MHVVLGVDVVFGSVLMVILFCRFSSFSFFFFLFFRGGVKKYSNGMGDICENLLRFSFLFFGGLCFMGSGKLRSFSGMTVTKYVLF